MNNQKKLTILNWGIAGTLMLLSLDLVMQLVINSKRSENLDEDLESITG